jgi:hypothetical protein
MKKIMAIIMILFNSVSSIYSQVWESKEIVTFPRSGMIQDEKISDELNLFDVYGGNDFAVCKSNGFFNLSETIEKNHIIYYDYKNSETKTFYDDYYIFEEKYIFNLFDFNINSIRFHKNTSDSLWITHYIADSTGSYFSKFNKEGKLLITKKFDKIYMTDWQDNDRGIILGKGLYFNSNSGYEWETLIDNISNETQGYNIADCKLYDNYIYMLANHKTENKSALFRYKLSYSENDIFEFNSELLHNNIEILDNEIFILGGKSRDIFDTYYKFIITKFNSLTEEFETIMDMNSKSEITHLLKRNDTLRAFATKDLFYADYTQSGWKYHENLNNEVIARFNKNNFREEEVRISFDSVYIVKEKTIYLITEKKTTAVTNNAERAFSINPNPAEDYIEIKISDNSRNTEALEVPYGESSKIEIYDVLGKKVLSMSSAGGGVPIYRDGGGQIKLDVSHLPKGVYFVKIGDYFEKFVKR